MRANKNFHTFINKKKEKFILDNCELEKLENSLDEP